MTEAASGRPALARRARFGQGKARRGRQALVRPAPAPWPATDTLAGARPSVIAVRAGLSFGRRAGRAPRGSKARARSRQGRLDESRRRPLARGGRPGHARPRTPRMRRRAPGAHGADRRARAGRRAPGDGRPRRRASNPRSTDTSAIPAPCPARPSRAGSHGGRRARPAPRAPSRLFASTRCAMPKPVPGTHGGERPKAAFRSGRPWPRRPAGRRSAPGPWRRPPAPTPRAGAEVAEAAAEPADRPPPRAASRRQHAQGDVPLRLPGGPPRRERARRAGAGRRLAVALAGGAGRQVRRDGKPPAWRAKRPSGTTRAGRPGSAAPGWEGRGGSLPASETAQVAGWLGTSCPTARRVSCGAAS